MASPRAGDTPKQAPGRARDPELDGAIATAALELLQQRGVAGLTIEAVSRRAGVARATVYRRWPNRNALLRHLLGGLSRTFPVPDSGCVRTDLIQTLHDQLSVVEGDAGKLYPLLGAQAVIDPAARKVLAELVERRRDALDFLLRRAIARKQIRSDFDVDLGLFLLWGPVYYRYLGSRADKIPIEADFIAKLVDSVLGGIGPTSEAQPSGGSGTTFEPQAPSSTRH